MIFIQQNGRFMLSLTRVWIFVWAVMCAVVPFSAKPVLQGGAVILLLLITLTCFRGEEKKSLFLQSFFGLPAQMMGGLLAFVVASMLWSVDPSHAAQALPRLTFIFLAGLVLIFGASRLPVPSDKDWGALVTGFIVGILAVIFLFITEFEFFAWVRGVDGAPAYVTNKAVGILTLMAPAVLLPLFLMGRSTEKVLCSLGGILLFIMVLATTGQSALLAFMVMVVSYFLPLRSKWFRRTLQGLLFFGVMGAPFIVIGLWSYVDAISQIHLLREASAPERMEVWLAITQKILERPFLGYGYDTTQAMSHFDTRQIYQPGVRFSHPHNLALQLWIEFGVLGALFLSWALITTLRRVLAHPNSTVQRLYFMSYAATVSVALVGWGMWQGWWMTLVLLIVFLNVVAGRVIVAQGARGVKPTDSPVTS